MARPSELSPGNLRAYWTCAAVLLSVDVLALVYLVWRVFKIRGKALVLRSFVTLLLGDACMVAAYLPHHTHNLIAWLAHDKGTGVEAAKDSTECRAVAGLVIVAFCLMCGGVPIASFQPYFLVRAGVTFSTRWAIRPRTVLASVLLCTTIGIVIVVACIRSSILGPYRGLYCAMQSYTSWESGGFMVTYTTVCVALATTGFLMTRRTLKKANQSARAVGHLVRASRTIQALSLKVTACFWVSFTPLAISGFVATLGAPAPQWFELLAGLLVKLKILVDVIVVLSLPVFRHADTNRAESRAAVQLANAHAKKVEGVVVWATPRASVGSGQAVPVLTVHEGSETGASDMHWAVWEEGEASPSECVV